MKWFTSDHHFFHKNIIAYCNRPFSDLDKMHNEIINIHNANVLPTDEVYLIGDISFSKPNKTNELLDRMNGIKILIKGNHDHSTTKWHINEIHSSLEIDIGSYKVLLSHYPYRPELPDEDVRYLDRRLEDKGSWLIHGHVHTLYQTRRKMINVGVDVWNFLPVAENTILEIISGK